MYLSRKDMKGLKLVEHSRFYLDYLEEHIDNVRISFNKFYTHCYGKIVGLDWAELQKQVIEHDISKFSKEEFVPYRDFFYPLTEKDRNKECKENFNKAVANHKKINTHHHESINNDMDIYHMVIDWMAMSMKFGGTPQEYYEENKDKINLTGDQIIIMENVFLMVAE